MINNGSTNWGGGITLNINDLPSKLGSDVVDYLEIPMEDYGNGIRWIEVKGRMFKFGRGASRNYMLGSWYEFDGETGTFRKGGDIDQSKILDDSGLGSSSNERDVRLLDVTSLNFEKGYFYVGVIFFESNVAFGYKVYRCNPDDNGKVTFWLLHSQRIKEEYYSYSNYMFIHGNTFYRLLKDSKTEKMIINESSMESAGQYDASGMIDSMSYGPFGAPIQGDSCSYNNFIWHNIFNASEMGIMMTIFPKDGSLPSYGVVYMKDLFDNMIDPLYLDTPNYGLIPFGGNKFICVLNYLAPGSTGSSSITFGRICEFDVDTLKTIGTTTGYLPSYNSYYFKLMWGDKHKFLYNSYTGFTESSKRHKYFWVWAE